MGTVIGEAKDAQLRIRGRRVLVVEDDPMVREVICDYLTAAELIVQSAADGFAALELIATTPPDLVVLDRMLPGVDGVEVCRRIRAMGDLPVIMLTALGEVDARIEGLEAGADDYLAKPFSPRELLLRVQSILRREIDDLSVEKPLESGHFRLDPSDRRVWQHGELLTLAIREFDLLEFLIKHPRQALRREQLLREVWQWTFGDLATVTTHVRRVREKVEQDPSRPQYLTTVWGVGYRFDPEGGAS